jgi:hypothetical protein
MLAAAGVVSIIHQTPEVSAVLEEAVPAELVQVQV